MVNYMNFEKVPFINIELLKIFIVIGNGTWDTISEEDKFLIDGDFTELIHLLGFSVYASPGVFLRTVFLEKYLLYITVTRNQIVIFPESIDEVKHNQGKLVNKVKYEKILSVCREHSNGDIIKNILLMISLSSSIDVCMDPKTNQLEYRKESNEVILRHEANLQARIASKIIDLHKNFSVILEKKVYIGSSLKNYRKPDINISYEGTELNIELKLGIEKSIVNRFNQDINKAKEFYDFALVIAYDPKQHIVKHYNLVLPKPNKEIFLIGSSTEFDDKIYFIVDRVIENKMVLRNKINFARREERKEIVDKINMAFYIENKNI